ncbi:hypothetical protein QYM36_013529 [Artemia franciscana]|uniref:Uncharacterized protein n=1 Tax=Artemia franciscana TaxID=6661 RepID=A0AA88HIZ6_ARTSF|nr:hypothetical protein QYM36_013529 [Artemia franciscana]
MAQRVEQGYKIKFCIILAENTADAFKKYYHTVLIVRELLVKMNVAPFPQPPFSPNLAPLKFVSFLRLKTSPYEHHHETLERVKGASTTCLKEVSVDSFQDTYGRWNQDIAILTSPRDAGTDKKFFESLSQRGLRWLLTGYLREVGKNLKVDQV